MANDELDLVANLTDPASYNQALERECNLVMKGGITSGVIYPLAICQLATDHRIAKLGGTSAGAIAAAVAAAAECGRRTGGFSTLAQLPTWLSALADGSKHTNLFHLFQPQAQTTPLFRLVAVFISRGGPRSKAVAAAIACVRLIRATTGPIVALLLPLLLLLWSLIVGSLVGAIASMLLGLVGLVIAVALSLWNRVHVDLEDNLFGLCSGMPADPTSDGPQALTPWLHDTLKTAAGITEDRPLTFGDLNDRDVTLRMFTTNVTTGTQVRLPFLQRFWAFDPIEFRQLFPAEVVDHMVAHPPEGLRPGLVAQFSDAGLAPMPAEVDLPVIVGVRMSLSFPALLSAVPLHAIDFTTDEQVPTRHWFSDGGATSNFPLHFFDEPVPDRPTFAIDLSKVDELESDEEANVWLPRSNSQSLTPTAKPISGFTGFLLALLSATADWADNMQKVIPGYRDRVVTVRHDATEGGINLDMDPEVVTRLTTRGQYAGALAQQRFDIDNHRWTRFRSFLQLSEELIGTAADNIEASFNWPAERGESSYPDLIADPPSYTDCSAEANENGAAAILDLAAEFNAISSARNGKTFADGAPRPEPEIQIRPNI